MFNMHLKLVINREYFDIQNIDLLGDSRTIKYLDNSTVKEIVYNPSSMHIVRGTGMDDINGKEIFQDDYVITNKGKYRIFYSEDSASFSLANFELTTDVIIDENVEVI